MTAESVRQFLVECYREVANLALNVKELNRMEGGPAVRYSNSGYQSLLPSASDPTTGRFYPSRVHCEEPGGTWEEQTRTKQLSPRGALLECQHPVRTGEILLVVRMDSGRQAQARVAWRWRKVGGPQEIGIEFLDRDNFWGVDWSAAEAVV